MSSDEDRLKTISTLKQRAVSARKLAADAISPEISAAIESYARDLEAQVMALEAMAYPAGGSTETVLGKP
jgi:hypothetical protein